MDVRPTAWQWDLRARIAQLVGVAGLIGLVVGAIVQALPVAIAFAVVMFGGVALSLVFALRTAQASAAERVAEYSTIFDFPGFALKDGRTLEVLRPADVEPERPGRRSLVRGILSTSLERLRRDGDDDRQP